MTPLCFLSLGLRSQNVFCFSSLASHLCREKPLCSADSTSDSASRLSLLFCCHCRCPGGDTCHRSHHGNVVLLSETPTRGFLLPGDLSRGGVRKERMLVLIIFPKALVLSAAATQMAKKAKARTLGGYCLIFVQSHCRNVPRISDHETSWWRGRWMLFVQKVSSLVCRLKEGIRKDKLGGVRLVQ